MSRLRRALSAASGENRATHAPGFHHGSQERGPRLRARPAIGRVGMAYAFHTVTGASARQANKVADRGVAGIHAGGPRGILGLPRGSPLRMSISVGFFFDLYTVQLILTPNRLTDS